ncbi:hypothetical protein MSC49_07350 [Methylosinus sp. C49]|uniref:peptidoglycan-binding domain-containing protein n=1 Tax=Methylosinus sp. C49 TaxID=2699395 RepID=UPI0013672F83|nr:peptidoglycan-binding domain-containing protein [Methylosinus sp. C49]BBU60800.1 hypothetical protein MSC49_07350 [Methylosinus sp. C49]
MRIGMRAVFAALGIVLASSVGSASLAGPYNPVAQAAQSKLAAQGYDPGVLDGVAGTKTAAAISAFQQKSGLPQSGALDAATLDKLGVGVSTTKPVADWIAVPTQEEIDKLVSAKNDPAQAYSNYLPNAPAAGLSLPGAAILAAMNQSADVYGSRRAGEPKHTDQGYQYTADCLKTNYAPTNWSDITIHYYCQMSKPRACYTYALSGKSTPAGVKYQRPAAYRGCAAGKLKEAADFVAFVPKTQPLVFQYVMFGQTHAFDHEQEQAIINAFYGVTNPADKAECKAKRPRRTEDPTDGSHCLVSKIMSPRLAGKGD